MSLIEGGESLYSIFPNQELILDFTSIVPDSPNKFGLKKNGFQIQSKPLNNFNNNSNNTSPEQISPQTQQQQTQQQQNIPNSTNPNSSVNPNPQLQYINPSQLQYNPNGMGMDDQLFQIFLSQSDKDNLSNINTDINNVNNNNNLNNNNNSSNSNNNNNFVQSPLIKLEDPNLHIQSHEQFTHSNNGMLVPDASSLNAIPIQHMKMDFKNDNMKMYNVVPQSHEPIFDMNFANMTMQTHLGLPDNLMSQQHQQQQQHQQHQQQQQHQNNKNNSKPNLSNPVPKKKEDDKIKKRKFISATPVKGENGTSLIPTTDCNANIEEERTMKRQRRLVKNREAAQLFRQRQKAYIHDLEKKVNDLTSTNSEFRARVELLNSENKLIREQLLYLRNFITQAVSFSFPPKSGSGNNSTGLGSPIPQGICPPDMLNLQNPMIMSAIAEAASKNSSFRQGFIGLPSPPLAQSTTTTTTSSHSSPTKTQQMVPFISNNTPPQQMSISPPQSNTPHQQQQQQQQQQPR
ncbi:putative basic-leucine zipper transcription factor [Tieghemostelium lacteum]|uniref:Putative basic-leucine zipper transcription factor n=1 Tax=Tieghemostelium lacteum TaxID=361077 RepID=A0A151Z9N2_TIELA|nr:putative basic-leucine zipper transcription factor [Tieghemostelium lacteum]|eukprot:KYQ90652.1 putative basic-leucine zipper transcription factor [Tieghemostelium lacteum]